MAAERVRCGLCWLLLLLGCTGGLEGRGIVDGRRATARERQKQRRCGGAYILYPKDVVDGRWRVHGPVDPKTRSERRLTDAA
jgi:hypothetical protein